MAQPQPQAPDAPSLVVSADGQVLTLVALVATDDLPGSGWVPARAETLVGTPPRPLAGVLREWLDEAQDRPEATRAPSKIPPGLAEADGWSLTSAELRVLRFLPSHLSLREIASRLYVSPNTIKTHVRAVYRKLDACSRAQAVEEAQRIGLLDQGVWRSPAGPST